MKRFAVIVAALVVPFSIPILICIGLRELYRFAMEEKDVFVTPKTLRAVREHGCKQEYLASMEVRG